MSGWSDKIVVTRTNVGTIDSTGLTTVDSLYVDYGVINDGTAPTAGSFYVYLYVDGVEKVYFTSAQLDVDYYTYYIGYPIGTLSAGTHTVEIDPNPSGVSGQTNATDHTYTKTITVNSPSYVGLAPYAPAGWSDKIVVARTTNTTTDSTNLTTVDSLYIDWAVINNGTIATTNTFYTYLYLDGVLKTNWATPAPLNTNAYTSITNFSIGSLSAATHTIEIEPNPSGVPGQTNASDNTYTKSITVSIATLPAPTLNEPANNSITQSTNPVFAWSSVAGASSYRIIVATNAADLPSSPTATNGGASVVINTTTSSTNFTPSTPLNPNTTYNWEVHGLGGAYYGVWSGADNFTTAAQLSGLTIIPTFDSTITSDPQAATIEATINTAIALYQSNFSTPITVYITYKEMTNGLGQSEWSYNNIAYTNYLQALEYTASSTDDATVLAHLPYSTNDPVTGNANINIKPPLARALGFNINGSPDGTISLNTGIMNYSIPITNSGKYSLFSTVCHEMDEVLGLGSALDLVKDGSETLTGRVFPEDLFRYEASGARSYTTNVSDTCYFSLDGTTDLAQFNQVASGDFGDWYSYYGGVTPQVQDAFLPPGVAPVPAVELRALDAIGYTRVGAAAAPVFQAVTHTNTTITLTWSAVSGQSYQVQNATNVLQTNWNNSGGTITASNTTASFTDTIGPGSQRYYRVALTSASHFVRSKSARAEVLPGPGGMGTNYLWPAKP